MDIQRTGLLTILAALTYIIFIQWNIYVEKSIEANEPIVNQISDPKLDSRHDPTEIPRGTGLNSPLDPNPSNLTEIAKKPNLIVVETPLFELTLDLAGGDIIRTLLKKYPKHLKRPNDPIALLDSTNRTYIAQSGLVGPDGPDAAETGRPRYNATANYYFVAEPKTISISATTDNGLVITKNFVINPNSYDIKVEHIMENKSSQPKTLTPFVQLKRDASADPSEQNSMGMQAFLGFALRTKDERYRKISFSDISDPIDLTNLNSELKDAAPTGGYLALLQHYFTSAWIPDDKNTHRYSFRQNNAQHFIGSIISPNLTINPNEKGISQAILYVGPKDQDALEALSPGLELVVDYGWLWFIAQPLFWCLKFIQSYVGNWGISIILVTIIVKAAFFQLSAAAYRSMAKMRKFTPEITRIRELHGDDKQRMSKEMMDLYKREKINPLGGCLPILVQMPVFIALYWVLLESVELRQAPFILWINDLSVKDPYFILPLLMGVSMYIQTSLNPTPPDPMQAKIMKWMPVAFTVFFLWFPAGLVLYWVCNNVLSIAQQWVITRSIEKADNPV